MIDYFTLALGHGLIALALIRLLMRNDLDEEELSADPTFAASDPARPVPIGERKRRQQRQRERN
ncbi:MAG: hypothetical protein R3E18_11380 [Sphingomonadaceae bacterium]|nr:hypothetical protein [Sphingomonadaceae bacterium]